MVLVDEVLDLGHLCVVIDRIRAKVVLVKVIVKSSIKEVEKNKIEKLIKSY